MTTLVWEVYGFDDVDESLGGVEERVQDARPVWDDVADAITDDQADWFDSQGNGTWRPLSKRYARWKARSKYAGNPPGVLTGGLRDSVVSHGEAQYSVRRWDNDELEVGTRNPVGTLQRDRGRPPLGPVTEQQESYYLELVERWVLYGEES